MKVSIRSVHSFRSYDATDRQANHRLTKTDIQTHSNTDRSNIGLTQIFLSLVDTNIHVN